MSELRECTRGCPLRNPSRVDAKRGDHFLQADGPENDVVVDTSAFIGNDLRPTSENVAQSFDFSYASHCRKFLELQNVMPWDNAVRIARG